ncbi:Uncharacterised protein [Mycobacteroides abscessus]|nr:Uncharacterised protein [Mycobacteroides abscessus]
MRSRSAWLSGFWFPPDVAPCDVPARNMRVSSLHSRPRIASRISSAVCPISATFSGSAPAIA